MNTYETETETEIKTGAGASPHGNRDALFDSDPFDVSPRGRQLFLESFRRCAGHHYRSNPLFRYFWDQQGVRPEDLRDEHDLANTPAIMVNVFKEREMLSVPRERIVLTLTSSGTGGRKSLIYLDRGALDNITAAAGRIYGALGLVSGETTHYLCFSHDPKEAGDLGTAFSDDWITGLAPRGDIFYALKADKQGGFYFDSRGAAEALERFADSPHPVRIIGFPAHIHNLLETAGLNLRLKAGSRVLTGGGWKGFANREIPKTAFRALLEEKLGVPAENIRDSYGMVEHGIPYVDCERGRLHIPNYARVFIRSPYDLSLVPRGETGLIHLLCSYNLAYPSCSLLTTDWGRIAPCGCGLGGPTLEIMGRAGVHKHKGCAVTAAEMTAK